MNATENLMYMSLTVIETETLGVEWAAALYESFAADKEVNDAYARTAHRLCEEMEEDAHSVDYDRYEYGVDM